MISYMQTMTDTMILKEPRTNPSMSYKTVERQTIFQGCMNSYDCI